jgi:hypothetical protein
MDQTPDWKKDNLNKDAWNTNTATTNTAGTSGTSTSNPRQFTRPSFDVKATGSFWQRNRQPLMVGAAVFAGLTAYQMWQRSKHPEINYYTGKTADTVHRLDKDINRAAENIGHDVKRAGNTIQKEYNQIKRDVRQ